MCDHANDAEARRCACTGYGMGDPPCRCGRGKSLHENGIGRCVIPAARCHEFVTSLCDPMAVTTDHIEAAALAIMGGPGAPATHAVARRVAAVALMAGRDSVLARDGELERVRRQRDRLRGEVAALTEERNDRERDAGRSPVGLDRHQHVGASGHVGQGGVQPPDSGTGDLRVAGRTARGMVVRRLRRPASAVFPRPLPPPAGQLETLRRVFGPGHPEASDLDGRQSGDPGLGRRVHRPGFYWTDVVKGWYYGAGISVILVIGVIAIAARNGIS